MPARSDPLGHSPESGSATSVIAFDTRFNFGSSNQGHSSQFYRAFYEREDYWTTLFRQFGFGTVNISQ